MAVALNLEENQDIVIVWCVAHEEGETTFLAVGESRPDCETEACAKAVQMYNEGWFGPHSLRDALTAICDPMQGRQLNIIDPSIPV